MHRPQTHRRSRTATAPRAARRRGEWRVPSPRPAVAVLAALLVSVALAACGGSGSPSASNAASKEQSNEQNAETRLANFAKCMREHGVNAEAKTIPGGGQGIKVGPGARGASPAVMEAAQKACARYRPGERKVNLSPQQKVEQEEAVQKFAKCMREHGITVHASAAGGGISIGIGHAPGSNGPNPESPAFQQAQTACQKLLPRKGP
jgi:hypothetical protein